MGTVRLYAVLLSTSVAACAGDRQGAERLTGGWDISVPEADAGGELTLVENDTGGVSGSGRIGRGETWSAIEVSGLRAKRSVSLGMGGDSRFQGRLSGRDSIVGDLFSPPLSPELRGTTYSMVLIRQR
jgi:hypothetical protein